VFAQWLILDAASNAAGLVTTHGVQIRIAGGTGQVLLNLIGDSSSLTPTGNFLFPATGGGPVLQLLGVFG
jgi:hypothetical protein